MTEAENDADGTDGTFRSTLFVGVPIDLYLEMQSHNDAVGRDLMIAVDEGVAPELEARLRGLFGARFEHLLEARESMRAQVEAARSAGQTHVDIHARYREEDVPLGLDYLQLVEEADSLAAEGVIFVASPGERVARLRRWFMDEFRAQVHDERPPMPFAG